MGRYGDFTGAGFFVKALSDKAFKSQEVEFIQHLPCIAFTVFLYNKPNPVKM